MEDLIIKAVIGAGYGDEGKGLMTDYFCNKLKLFGEDNKVLNIKFNGGAQAGHTVSRIDKREGQYKHWVFAQYGAGTFTGADTYLAKEFNVNIALLLKEHNILASEFGVNTKVYIDGQCRAVLPIDIELNKIIEDTRDEKRHGSCGLGVYETWHRNEWLDRLTIQDIVETYMDGKAGEQELLGKLQGVMLEYIEVRGDELRGEFGDQINDGLNRLKDHVKEYAESFIKDVASFVESESFEIRNIKYLVNEYKALVFEGAQGLEISMNTLENAPHLTPSDTGIWNVLDLIRDIKSDPSHKYNLDFEVCYVTRSYKTRHGNGPFKEYDSSIQETFNLYDTTNVYNHYQGGLKYGNVDIERMATIVKRENVKIDRTLKIGKYDNTKLSLAVTHLDQTNGLMSSTQGLVLVNRDLCDVLGLDGNLYRSYGDKASDIVELY